MADEQEPGAVGDDAALMDAFVLPGMAPRNAPDVEPALEPFGGMPERATVAPEEPKDEGPDYLRASTTGVEADDYEAGIIERQQQLEYAYKQNNPGANDDEAMTWAKKEADKYRFLPPYRAPDTTIEGRAGKGLAMRVLGRRVISMPEPTEPGERPQAAMDSQIAERDKVTRQIMSMGPAEAILKTWSGSHKPMTLDEANAGGLFLEEDLRATDNELMVGAGVGGALGLASAGTLIAKGVAEGAPMGPWGMVGMAAANLAMGSAIGYFGTGVGKSYDAEDFWSASDNPLYESDDGEFRIVVAKGLQDLSGRAQSKLGIWDAASTTMGLVSDDWSEADKKRMDRQIENAAPGQEFNALVSMSDHIDSLAEEGLKANDPKMKQAREQFAVTYLSLPKVSLTKQILDDYKIDVERSIRTKWPKKTQDWVDRQVARLTTVSPLRLKRVMTAQPLLEDREDLKFLNRVIGKLKAGASDEDLQKALDTVPVWELAEAGLLIGEVKSDGKSVAMAAFPTPYHVSVTGAVRDSSEIQEATGTKTSAVMERAFGELMLKRVKDSHELGRINVVEGNVGRAMRLMGGATDLFMEAPFAFAGIDRAYGLGIRPEGASYTENVLGAVSSGMSGVTWNAMASMHRAGWDRESAAYKWALGGAVAADFLAPWEEMSVAVPITAMKSFHRMATIPGRVLPKGSPKGKMRAAMASPPAYRAYHKLVHGKDNAPVYGDTYAVVEHVIDSMIRENIISGKMHGKEVPKLIESQMEILAQRLGVEGGFDALRSKVEGVSEKTFGSMLESIHDIMENGTPVSRGLRSSDGYQATLAQINKAVKDGTLTNTHAAMYMGLLEIQAMRHSQNPDLPDIQTPEDFFKKVQHRYGPDTGPPIAGPGPGPKPGPKPGRKPRPKARESFKLEKENVELAEKAVKKAKAKLAKLIEASKKAQAVKEPTPEPTIKGGKDLEAAIEAKDAADDAVVKAKKTLSDEKAKLSAAKMALGRLRRGSGAVDPADGVFLEGLWAAPKIMKEDTVDLILSHLGYGWKRLEGLKESDGSALLGDVPEQIGVFVNDRGDAVFTPVMGGRYGGLGYFVKPPDGISATALMEQGHLPTMGVGKVTADNGGGLEVLTKAGEVPAGGNSLIQAMGHTRRPGRLEGRKKKIDAATARVTQAEMDLNDANRAAEAADVAVTRATEEAAPVEATTDVAKLPPPTVGKTEPERVAIARARSDHERVGRGIVSRDFEPTGSAGTVGESIRQNLGDSAVDAYYAEIAILRDFEIKKYAESNRAAEAADVAVTRATEEAAPVEATTDVADSPAIKAAQEDLSKLERRLQKAQSSLDALRDGLVFEMPKISSRPLGFDDITDLAQEVGVDPYSPAFKDKLGELGFDGIPVEQRSISQVYALLQSGHFGGDVEAFVPPNFVDGFMPADWVGGRFSLPDGTTVYAVKDGNGRIVGRGDTSIEAVSQAVAMAEMMDPGTKFRSPIDTTSSSVGPIHVSMEIADVEPAMIGARVEYGVLFDAETGQQLGRFSGDTGSVYLAPRFMVSAMVHGNLVFTHNHPLGFPFSPQDIMSAVVGNFAEIRAVSSIDGKVYSLKRPEGGWGEQFDFGDLMREDSARGFEAIDASEAVTNLRSSLDELSITALAYAVSRMTEDILDATDDMTRAKRFQRIATRWLEGDYGSGAHLSEYMRGEPTYNAETFSRYLDEEAIKNIDRVLEAIGLEARVEVVELGGDVAPGSGVVTPIDPVLRAAERAGVEADIPGSTFKSLFGDLFKSKPKKVDEVPDVVEPDVAAKIDEILEVLEEGGVILTPGKLDVDLDRMNKMKEAGGLAVETKGELGMDKARMISLLGASMYRGDIGEITVKELVQNSFDGLKAAQHSGQIKPGEGRIYVDIDLDDFSITVADNGSGMTAETVQKAFFTIGGTDKGGLPPSMRSGGLGMAKMAFLFSAKRIELTTIRNGTKTTVVTTPESIQADSFTIRQEPTDEPSGTVVKIVLPREIEDLHTGETKAIHLSPVGTSFVHEPMIGDVKLTQAVIRSGRKYDYSPQQGVDFDLDANPKLTSATFDWGSADIYMSVERAKYPNAHILSSGLYQFKWFPQALRQALPFNIIVDIKPDVDPTHAHYPFNQQREGFRGTIKEDVKALAAYLIRHGSGLEAEATAKVFETTVSMKRVDLDDMLDDIETRRPAPRAVPKLEPEDVKVEFDSSDIVITDGSVEVGGRTVLTKKEVENVANAKESFKADKAGKSASSFFDTVKVDPKTPLFHNNTNMEIPESAHQMMAKLGTVVLEFRERLAKIYGYEGLDNLDSPYASGLSLDKSYHGVHVKVPYKAFFLNPLATRGATADGVVGGWVHTLIHEGAHFKVMRHDELFTMALSDLHVKLADSGDDLIIREALTQVLDNHWDDFFALRSEYERSTTKNVAQPLEAGSKLPTDEDVRLRSRVSGARGGEVQDGGRPSRGVDEGPGRGPEDDPGATGATVIDAIHANLVGGRGVEAPAQRAPHQMTQSEYLSEYVPLNRRVEAAEKTPERRMSPEESELMTEDWEAYSRSRGYTESEIADLRRLMELSPTHGFPQEYASDAAIHWDHVRAAIREGKAVPAEVLEDYPEFVERGLDGARAFDEIEGDPFVWVFHSTDGATADSFLSGGVRAGEKPQTIGREMAARGEVDYAPGRGASDGLYVGGNTDDIPHSRRFLAIKVRRSELELSPESSALGYDTVGGALNSQGAIIRGNVPAQNIVDVGVPGKSPNMTRIRETLAARPAPRAVEAPAAATLTDEFKSWFDGSIVVDADGKPMIVFHGVAHSKGFEAFDTGKAGSASLDSGWYGEGFYFSDNPSVASVYAGGGIRLDKIADSLNDAGFAPTSGTGSIAPVYLSLRNPYDVGQKPFGVRGLVRAGQRLPDDIHAAVVAKVGFDPSAAKNPFRAGESKTGEAGAKVVREYLKSKGFPDYWAGERVKSYLENPDGFWFRLGEGTMSIDALTRALKADGFDGILQREANAGTVTLPWADWGVRTTGDAETLFSDAMTATLKEQGYDGVVADLHSGWKEYMVFEPNQIKSTLNRKPTDDPRILYSGPPEAPKGTFEIDANTGRMLIRLFETGDIGTLFHENGHLLEALLGAKWKDELFEHYGTEMRPELIGADVKAGMLPGDFPGRRLSRAGSEQLAQAFKAYLETRVGPGGPVKRKFVELYRTMQDMWLRTRNQPETLPPEMLALFDGYFRPTDVAMDGAVGLTAAVFDGRMPTVHLDSDLATRLSEGKVREAQQKMSWERIDILDEHVRQATGITEDITEMSAVDLYARLYAYVATEQSRKLTGPMGLTSITERSHVPRSRLKQIQAEIRDRLSYYNQARPKDVAAQVTRITRDGIELEVIELNDAQAAGFKRMVEDIAGEPMGNIIFSRMLDPEFDYSNPTPIEYNVVIEAMKDVVSGPGGRKTGYSQKISPSMGYAIWNAFKSGANRLSDEAGLAGFKGTRDFLKKWFNVEQDVAHLDPIVRSLIQARMRGISDAPDWARRRAMRVAKEVRASKTGDSEGMNVHVEILNDLRETLEWPIHPSKVWLDEAEVSPLLEMHKRFERIHRAEVERARLWDKERPDRFPNSDEYADLTTEELFADLDQIKAMLREEGVRLPDNVAAAVDVLEIYKKRLRATPVDELGESQQFELGGAIDEIYYALQGKVDTVVEKAADMATSITGSEGSGIHGAMSLDQQMQLYSWFYSGQFEKMIDFVSQRGFHTGLEKQKMSRLDMSEVMLEMIIRMKAQQEFNGLLEDLTRYHLRFDVRDLGSEKDFGPNFDRTAFAERVKHYLKSQVGGDRSIRQMWAQGGKAGLEAPVAPDPSIYPPRDRIPGPIDSSPVRRLHDMRAYFKAMEIIDRWGVGSFVGAWDTFKFPDGTEVFIPVEAKVALQDAIDRAAGVGATYGRTTLGKKFLPERKGLPTKDPGISERLERTPGVEATSAVAKALNWLFYMNPLTAARIKMGITTGVIVPNAPYYVGVGIGALFQMYQGLGATATVKALFKNPRMTTAVIARLFKDGGYRPNAPAMVTPDGRIYTADMLADMAQRYSLNQSFVKAETVGSVADDITNMTPDGVVERISSGFGRWQDTLVESTTALDNFFRVSTFLHELEAGASPKAAASLARKVGFDYSELSEFERKSCRDVILFYSYMRKNQDLFWDTMLTNPSRVIGQIRLVRGLHQANVEDDAEIVIPDHLKTRLPVYFRDIMEQTHVNRQTMWITPPLPFADVVNLYVDLFGTVESMTSSAKNPDPIRATMARLTPWVQAPFIMAFHKDLFFDRDLDKINRVPSVFIEADYMLTGGMISEDLLDVTDQPKYDPMTETVPGFGFYHAQNGKAWWVLTKFLQVPGFGRSMSVLESLDRANTGAVEVPLKAAKAFRMYGVREGFLDYPKPKNFKLPSDLSEDIAGPRHYNELSGFDEFMGFMGIRPVPITKENVKWAQLIRRHGYDLKDQVKKDEQSDMYKRR